MKRVLKSRLGVTLLEVMLVLAIAAMIIVMSIRYYQSASSSQQANSVLEQIQGIVAAADGLAQAKGSYSAAGISQSSLTPLLPGGSWSTPWGDPITIGDVTGTTYTIDLGTVPSGVCPLLTTKLSTNNHFTLSAPTCTVGSGTAEVVTYTSNP